MLVVSKFLTAAGGLVILRVFRYVNGTYDEGATASASLSDEDGDWTVTGRQLWSSVSGRCVAQ